jgi:hypothetical protein
MAQLFNTFKLENKIDYIAQQINNEIVKWYIRNGYKSDLNEFRPGFITDDEYEQFIECFEILKQNQTENVNENQLLYNLIIYYYLLVIVECYILDNSYCFRAFNNELVEKWMFEFSLNQSEWASTIRRKLMNFNSNKFNSFHIVRFNPFEQRYLKNKSHTL